MTYIQLTNHHGLHSFSFHWLKKLKQNINTLPCLPCIQLIFTSHTNTNPRHPYQLIFKVQQKPLTETFHGQPTIVRCRISLFFLGKLVFWWANLWNIWFLEPMFMKYEKQLLFWKFMCFMHSKPTGFFVPRLPIRVSRLAAFAGHVSTGWNWTGWNKIWASHKNTLVDGSFFPLSHLIPIPLIFLHSITEAIWASHKTP